ncbi:hypothetical protein K437DRAFT_254594 [Tilletiaria anomala UBC 951]|uniref:Uncharacterized protein n=1 Tax=Tilletiaria anomala (strain ATCC 24038 / CBS 436.72 / UBC 951) TaxID=1037660 RepID=A0A066WE48_TILAU|nr:uncharacterized protein K437DRAFT_254594 [Tilletiaria anomala UBC 951]KDN52041.1 hypothetical protein K437DRAFT_254594 [Tilletiaria anomala UBC 951]
MLFCHEELLTSNTIPILLLIWFLLPLPLLLLLLLRQRHHVHATWLLKDPAVKRRWQS